MDGLTCNRLAVLGSHRQWAPVALAPLSKLAPINKESKTDAIDDRHYWVTDGYCL